MSIKQKKRNPPLLTGLKREKCMCWQIYIAKMCAKCNFIGHEKPQSHTSVMKSITHWYLHYNTTFVQTSNINRNKHPYSLFNNCHAIIYAKICRNCQK